MRSLLVVALLAVSLAAVARGAVVCDDAKPCNSGECDSNGDCACAGTVPNIPLAERPMVGGESQIFRMLI